MQSASSGGVQTITVGNNQQQVKLRYFYLSDYFKCNMFTHYIFIYLFTFILSYYQSIFVECFAANYPAAASADDLANSATSRRHPNRAANYDPKRRDSTDSHPAEPTTVTGKHFHAFR